MTIEDYVKLYWTTLKVRKKDINITFEDTNIVFYDNKDYVEVKIEDKIKYVDLFSCWSCYTQNVEEAIKCSIQTLQHKISSFLKSY
jgi:hypothetical protein